MLAGGTGRRLDHTDKAELDLGDETLLDRALRTVAGIGSVVVVGPDALPTGGLRTVREEPAYGGPAAGMIAGLRAVPEAETVLVLAVDMPGVAPATVERLVGALDEHDGAVLHDGRRQPLCGVYRRTAVLATAPADASGLAVRDLLAGLRLAEVDALPGEALDVDTWADLDDARARLQEG
ncbi:hypothetical protein GCM10011519_23120 [Marmoricola endophyticus]|uniref:MobA-like NTP transferase domain-containing protein n=1 Tax=Marmoricola endophyticus TaxID=2040280 RepID=A0A917BLQ4_9ACTN|nr:hypothetical protein GCM10011519_23120 [Marmoricola endophyticus]